MGNNVVITIGREFGSGGREIGKKVADRLGIKFYDKELLQEAAETKAAIAAGEWPVFDTVDELSEALGL